MSIPKIIHQIYLQGEANIPENIKESIQELRSKNPDWDYKLYDDSIILEFIQKHYDQAMLDLYLSINPCYAAARSDLFRYLLLYQKGGVYLDLKSSCTQPFNSILTAEDEFIICGWENEKGQQYEGYGRSKYLKHLEHGEYQQWNIIAKEKSPFLKSVIDEVTNRLRHYSPLKYHVGRKGVLNTTGPIPYSIAIEKLIKNQKNSYRYIRFSQDINLVYKNANTEIVNRNHYSQQLQPIVKLNLFHHYLYIGWLFLLHPKKVRSKKNKILEIFKR